MSDACWNPLDASSRKAAGTNPWKRALVLVFLMLVVAQMDLGVSQIPDPVFTAIHLALVVVAAFFAYRMFTADANLFGWAFAVYAVGEVVYIGYHVGATTFLLSHLVAEVLFAVAIITFFVAVSTRVLAPERSGARHARTERA